MQRALIAAILVLIVTGAAYAHIVHIAHAAQERDLGFSAYPAPFGYLFKPSAPIKMVVGLEVNGYIPYKAYVKATGYLFYPVPMKAVLTPRGWYRAVITFPKNVTVIGLYNGTRVFVVSTANGKLYYSTTRILFNYPPYYKNNDIIISNVLNLDVPRNVSITVIMLAKKYITVISNGTRKSVPIVNLLGISQTCLVTTRPTKDFPWTGGVLPTPICIKNIKPVMTVTYKGMVLAPVIAKKIGNVVLVLVFSRWLDNALLERMHIISPLKTDIALHTYTAPRGNLYYAPSQSSLIPVKMVNAQDATVISNNGTRFCIVPKSARILLSLRWQPGSPPRGTPFKLGPGEVVVFKVGNVTYYCNGPTDFIHSHPIISFPQIAQFHQPVVVNSKVNTLVVLGNGKYYYGKNIAIGYDEYTKNTIWVVNSHPHIIPVNPTDIWMTPAFWSSILIGIVIIMVFNQRYKQPPKKITIEIDTGPPTPLKIADERSIARKARQYIERFGVCPTDIELAMEGILVPYRGEKATQEIVVCPFKTNPETETVLRKVVKAARWGFWALKRSTRSAGYLYTIIGGTLLYYYVYKQENEKRPAELLGNAVNSINDVYVGHALSDKREKGLIIVVNPNDKWRFKKELESAGVIDSQGRVHGLFEYLSVHGINVALQNKGKDKNAKIERLYLVSSPTEIVEILGETASAFYLEYLRVRGDFI